MLPDTFRNRHACCFTGHRARYLPAGGAEALRAQLEKCVLEAITLGVSSFLAGGADGFDTLSAEAVLRCRAFAPDVRLILALPSKTQADRYDDALQARYARILDGASEVHYASDCDNTAFAMRARNRYLVDHADCCIAYLNRPVGGTLYTVNYALNCGLPVYNLAEARL